MSSNYDVLHITTVHPRGDVRIAIKELYSIMEVGKWKVGLVVADGYGNSVDNISGLVIEDIGLAQGGRIGRFIIGSWQAFLRIRLLNPRLIHFHDPELILLGLVLKCFGYKVIYDVHEDVPRQIMDKHWIPSFLKPVFAMLTEGVEWVGASVFDNIITVTPKIAERFPNHKTVLVRNFSRLEELVIRNPVSYSERPSAFVYVGGITIGRGIREMIEAVNLVPEPFDCRLELAGIFKEPKVQDGMQSLTGWSQVRYHGWVSRSDVARLLGNVCAGLLVLHPLGNHVDSYPTKLFEYMATGLPVIASDFPLWRQIISDVDCALFVDPLNPQAIANAMQWILEHPEEAEAMGHRGRNAVEQTYNWKPEAKKLLDLYATLLNGNA